ncbi:hypothetical protein EJ06DRAFT_534242 [Trichodelitschia bisporula]|uniref:GDS1 winged helix domain-containing protein n=1 Tax=Trichodelitschia bisporula TaxID=703511 RepID=A0A6G1HJC3_9PEZI|nr:hypothetical protein EJ06DRAFT_534242 [Trichodelitschia bisporula]
MAYNTRRKSVSLSQLGIRVPAGSRAAPRAAPPSTDEPPAKKVKRAHDHHRKPERRRVEHTPPPSPGEDGAFVDTEGIDDEIVVAVIKQLEKTGNRPHLLKELAAVLCTSIPIVTSSANQSAIISSRLANYLRRSWTAMAPCPLGKELVGTHPKRIYFFLTTQPRQPLPAAPDAPLPMARIISPSLTSADDESDPDSDAEDPALRARAELSPSPEVDLSAPELEGPEVRFDPHGFSGVQPPAPPHNALGANTPPLERDEREFTATACSLQRRRMAPSVPVVQIQGSMEQSFVEESDDGAAWRNKESAELFGFGRALMPVGLPLPLARAWAGADASSPMLKPAMHAGDVEARAYAVCCEAVQLEELEDLFEAY